MKFPKINIRTKKRVYLDFAAATPVHPDVWKYMVPYFTEDFGNPSAVHNEGVRSRVVIENARVLLAKTLHVRPRDITFTSGGTESNNLALFGTIEAIKNTGRAYEDMELITTRIEHPSMIQACDVLHAKGVTVTYVPVTSDGRIDAEAFATLLSLKTVLVAISYANSEIGVVQDVKRMTRIVKKFNTAKQREVVVHLDASQAPLWLPCQMDMLGVDLMTLDAGKCCGPKGIGVLVHRPNVALKGLLQGGDQEFGLRPGTENTPLIIGCVTAVVRAQTNACEQALRVSKLRDFMMDRIQKEVPEAILNGSREDRIANNVNISIPGCDSEYAVITLDAEGVAASTKSACSGATGNGSYVVRAIADEARALSTIRFSLGETTTEKELIYAVDILKEHMSRMRIFSVSVESKG